MEFARARLQCKLLPVCARRPADPARRGVLEGMALPARPLNGPREDIRLNKDLFYRVEEGWAAGRAAGCLAELAGMGSTLAARRCARCARLDRSQPAPAVCLRRGRQEEWLNFISALK